MCQENQEQPCGPIIVLKWSKRFFILVWLLSSVSLLISGTKLLQIFAKMSPKIAVLSPALPNVSGLLKSQRKEIERSFSESPRDLRESKTPILNNGND